MEAAGIIDKAEVRAWGMNEAYEIAQERVDEIQTDAPNLYNEV